VTGDHTDTAQVLSADQNPALAQASATVKVNVWSLDIAKAVTGTRGRLPGWTPRRAGPAVSASRPRVLQARADIIEFLFDQDVYTNRDVSYANVK
jgi:hypothetical protein